MHCPNLQSVPLIEEVISMADSAVRDVFLKKWETYRQNNHVSHVQSQAANAILACKTPSMGFNASLCDDCSFLRIHYCSYGNRNCPHCQQVEKERWIDQRRSEVLDAPYFHVVFTLPSQLRSLVYANQKLLYDLLHTAASRTVLCLSQDKRYLGASPGIIQILHTWNQTLEYHPHIHCIVSGAGLTRDLKLKKASSHFFIPVKAMMKKFRGMFPDELKKLYRSSSLYIPDSCSELNMPSLWSDFIDMLYRTDWCPFIKETFNGFGNAIDYLGRYTHRIAISNRRIIRVSDTHTTFWYRDRRDDNQRKEMTLENCEFIRRFLMHVLPKGFRKIRYYGFLNNRFKKRNLHVLFSIQGRQQYVSRFSANASAAQILKERWNIDICTCPKCGAAMRFLGNYRRRRC